MIRLLHVAAVAENYFLSSDRKNETPHDVTFYIIPTIEGIALEYFRDSHHSITFLESYKMLRHAMFHFFCLTIENNFPQPQPHAVNVSLNCCKTEHYYLII